MKRFSVALLCIPCLFSGMTLAAPNPVQFSDNWAIGFSYGQAEPIGMLRARYLPTSSFALGLTNTSFDHHDVRGYLEYLDLGRTNHERLHYDDIQMRLQILGLGVDWLYRPLAQNTGRRLDLFVGGGLQLDYWKNERDTYEVVVDSTESFMVEGLTRQEAAWGFGFSAGANYRFLRHMSLDLELSYRVIMASLWPALDMRLESVDGFQFLRYAIGISYVW